MSQRKLGRVVEYRIFDQRRISPWVETIAAIGSCVAIHGDGTSQCGFLGCPLSVADLRDRFRLADVYVLAFSGSTCVGYCYGYTPAAFALAKQAATENMWVESDLFGQTPPDDYIGCIFQDAVDFDFRIYDPRKRPNSSSDRMIQSPMRRLGVGRNMVRLATDLVLSAGDNAEAWGFIPAVPMNYMNYNLALRIGYKVHHSYAPLNRKSSVQRWNILRIQNTL